jgi:hypothetical protein
VLGFKLPPAVPAIESFPSTLNAGNFGHPNLEALLARTLFYCAL